MDDLDCWIRRSHLWKAQDALLRCSGRRRRGSSSPRRFRGRRAFWGRRAAVRTLLYMAAVSARRYPGLRACYHRLIAVGKVPKLALTACMHRFLVILNAMAKRGRRWQAPAPVGA